MDQLISMLSDPSWVVRREVVAQLAALADLPLRALRESLRANRGDETRIAATVDTLVASTGDTETELVSLAHDPNPAVLADVAQILGRRRNPRSIATLIELTEHTDDNVAVAAIEALGRLGGRSAVDALVRCIESQHFFRVFPAIDVLGRSGDPRAVAPLSTLLKDPRYTLEAARALGRTGDRSAVSALSALLASPSDGQVRVGALALDELYGAHRERYGLSVEDLLKSSASEANVRRVAQCLNGADLSERIALCRVLGAFRNRAAQPALVRMLDAQKEVAAAAAEALQQVGQESDTTIVTALMKEGATRRQVLLPLVGHSSALPAVLGCLADPDATVRAQACDALARIGDASIVSHLFALLDDDNTRVVHAATGAIQSLGSKETEALLLKAARSDKLNVRRAAIRILGTFGFETGLEVFREGLQDVDARVRESSVLGLAFVDHPGARALLLSAARHDDAKLRAAAMRAIGQCPLETESQATLLDALSDVDPWVRYYACQSLGKLRAEQSAQAIARLLDDEAGQVRVAAIESLSHLQDVLALNALRNAAQSSDPDIERAALLGLSITRDEASLSVILSACASPDAATRLVALSAAAAFANDDVCNMLARTLRDTDESVRTAALGFLTVRPERAASRFLIDALQDEIARPQVLRALATYTATRVPVLLKALEDADEERAPLLSSCLSRLQHPDATAALFQALRLPKPAARKAAITTLAAIGSREAFALIAELAIEDPDPEVRRISALCLAE
jgi:HEAT repeat protein